MRTSFVLLACLPLFACQTAGTTDTGASGLDAGRAASLPGAFADAAFASEPSYASPVVVTAVDAVTAQLLRAAVVAHDSQRRVLLENLANVTTVAYKRRVLRTATQGVAAGDGMDFQLPVVLGVDAVFLPGAIEVTDRSLDVAIDGEGFFAICLLDGSTGYTRDGQLQVNADGKMVTSRGSMLLPVITLPNDTLDLSIAPDGGISCRTASSPDSMTMLGQLTLHRFVNPVGLRSADGIYKPSEASGAPISNTPGSTGLGFLKQGCLERSNVQTANELMQLQTIERQHEVLLRVLRQFGFVAP